MFRNPEWGFITEPGVAERTPGWRPLLLFVEPRRGSTDRYVGESVTQGALRDPGLRCKTPSAFSAEGHSDLSKK